VGSIDDRLIVTGDYSHASGEAALDRLLDQAPDIDAVFVGADLMAEGAVRSLRRRRLRVPHDIAVGGFDDGYAGTADRLSLTTIRQPWHRISAEVARLLLLLIQGDDWTAVTLPAELVVRGST
jgi:DNA-binding LacI/PurR family transcriptional regulator